MSALYSSDSTRCMFMETKTSPRWGIRISTRAVRRYPLRDLQSGLLVASDTEVRGYTDAINSARESLPDQPPVTREDLRALILLDAIFRHILKRYEQSEPTALPNVWGMVEEQIDAAGIALFRKATAEIYPTPLEDLEALLERVYARLTLENPAATSFGDLVGNLDISSIDAIDRVAHEAFRKGPKLPGFDDSIIDVFFSIIRSSESLREQLDDAVRLFRSYLDPEFLASVLSARDLLAEATKWVPPRTGPPKSEVYSFEGLDVERFSDDREWMSECVMVAKNTFVWLHQLSKTHGMRIQTLDQIPDREFERLRERGINALWLIGLWQRSDASREIKKRCGSDDAVASAYSLYDYRIADELGGEGALEALKAQAHRFGVRLAADMVPNHVGIVSKWVIEHPDWFLSTPDLPFESYTFNGPDLCDDDRVSIHLEDSYYTREDAAVVFKHYDHRSGQTRYIYHGNDGTSMPWNDTAQIDYLNPEAREAVIQVILDVAKNFPLIRFDAAMTLVNKHIQRLWYPQPGSAGAIPSRSRHGMSEEEFSRRMPREFWSEVVDRVSEQAPDTLLLAEAFWMLEGYFVRSLGMHRVYNSAFMNMLRDEENGNYQEVLKNTIAFDAQILRRYVNFMNNPDEETAEAQFGKGDKYFGIATMMVTLPGLPMFGHGQIEGLSEKYGMDFYRPLLDESPDEDLMREHERRIFGLLHRRWLFSRVENFELYPFISVHGAQDPNVFAYSNRRGSQRALVIHHNRYASTQGWVGQSYEKRTSETSVQRSLADGLNLHVDSSILYRFRDAVTGLHYLFESEALQEGFYVELGAYQTRVLWDWYEIHDHDGRWSKLARHLKGQGVADLEHELKRLDYAPIYQALEALHSGSDAPSAFAELESELEAFSEAPSDRTRSEDVRDDTALAFLNIERTTFSETVFVALYRCIGPTSSRRVFDELSLGREVQGKETRARVLNLRAVLDLCVEDEPTVDTWLTSLDLQRALDVHRFDGTRWFRGENAQTFVADAKRLFGHHDSAVEYLSELERLEALLVESEYDFDRLIASARKAKPDTRDSLEARSAGLSKSAISEDQEE